MARIGMRVVNKKGVREKGRNEEEKKGQLARRGRGISRGRGIREKGGEGTKERGMRE